MEAEKKLNLSLSVANINTLLVSLGKMPFESVASLIPDIQRQAQAQLESVPAPAEEEDKPAKKGPKVA